MLNSLRRRVPLAALVLVAGLSLGLASPAAMGQTGDKHAPESAEVLTADANVYRQHIFTLANPWFEGRCPGDRGNADAADYIEFYFRRAGLTPAFTEDGKAFSTFHQYFVPGRLQGGKLEAVAEGLTAKVAGGDKVLAAGKDMRVLAISGTGKLEGSPVFVGYGIPEGNDGYKGFTGGVELKGKIALLMRFEPMKADGNSKWAETGWSPRADLPAKVTACFDHGATAVVLVNAPGASDNRASRLMSFTDGSGSTRRQFPGPVLAMSNTAAAEFVAGADANGRSLEDLRKLADASGDMIDLPKGKLAIDAEVRREEHRTSNVAGVIKGKGALADEYVVIGAHYDHVGYGDFGSNSNARGVIHPGADDNGSGTSGVLTVAQKLSDYYAKLPADANCRSLLIMTFSAEESGLEGSRFYTRNMIAAKDKHYVMLNMDMIGRLRDEPPLEVSGLGTSPTLAAWLKPYWDNAGFAIRPLVQRSQFDDRSDHASFHRANIPAIFFFTGLHDDYHRPIDTADKINIDGAVKIVDLVYRIAIDASTRTEPLPFGDGSKPAETKPVATTPTTPTRDETPTPSGPGMGRVSFGIAPAYDEEGEGVVAAEVRPNTPAEKAGLKAEDRILTWNGEKIASVADFAAKLRGANPGDKIKVKYTRGGKEAETEVTLAERK